ncbi:gephyrin-like molybdotransferase Glp [Cellulomonas sp. SG140]|uniref:molybdopterin molybdotransferase MoeA n=1 Tax=Cellulomonas sp. SG140 TaxID=2976536 RepID=UPI0021E932DC|nr:gephyrin-like molybdotransferase Glp [Cellulomonas sp. SG140]
MSGLVPVAEHLARVLAVTPTLPAERVPLAQAAGRRVAEDVHALVPVPPWDASAMDGYALRHADVAGMAAQGEAGGADDDGVTLDVVADVPAGSDLDPHLAAGQAVRIMTGATLPTDADTVVQLEHTDRTDTLAALPPTVTVLRAPSRGMHVRRTGEDKAVGDLVVPAGTLARATVLSALASTGHGSVLVTRTPRVVVIATGSELVAPGEPLPRGHIPDSNSLLVSGLVAEAGGEVVAAARVHDDPAALASALDRAVGLEPDAVILTGGVSAGAFDPVKQLFTGSSDVEFTKVAMQPGKPQAFGTLPGGALLLALPGNPVSVWVSFHVFVRPALLTMQGAEPSAVQPAPVRARAATSWRTPAGRTQYLPVRVAPAAEGWSVEPAARRGSASHLVGSLAAADGYAIVPAKTEQVQAGDLVDVVLTDRR